MGAIVAILRRFRSDSGAELVEFALAFPLLLLVVLGIVDFGFLFQEYEVITNAAREGARIASLPEYQANAQANVTVRVNQYLGAAGLNPALATVSVPPPTLVPIGAGLSCVATYTITVSYPHAFSFVTGIASYFGGGFANASTLTATSTMRAEGIAGTCT